MVAVKRFATQSYISFKALFGWLDPKSYIFIKIVSPVFQLLFFCLIARYCYNTTDLAPYVLGNALLLCVSNCIFGLGTIFIIDKNYGTIKSIIAMPTSKFILFIQRGLPYAIDSLSSVVIGAIIGIVFFKIDLREINIGVLFIIVLVAMFAVSGFGLLIGVCSLLTTETNILLNLCNMALIALSGANFPVSSLPFGLKVISSCLPLSRSVKAINIMLDGGTINDIVGLLKGEVFIGLLTIIIGYIMLRVVSDVARKNGTLELC